MQCIICGGTEGEIKKKKRKKWWWYAKEGKNGDGDQKRKKSLCKGKKIM
jgi:hypothetical protein